VIEIPEIDFSGVMDMHKALNFCLY